MKHYVIGDVHGCYLTLLTLINKLPFEKGDKLVFVGDYIDRGKFSKEVVEYIKEMNELGDAIAIKGNHEVMACDFYNNDPNGRIWMINGGKETIQSYYPKHAPEMIDYYSDDFKIDQDHLDWMASLPLSYETEKYFIVHAGVRPNIALAEQHEDDLIWIRNHFLNSDYDWGKTIVFGHTPMKDINLELSNKIPVDTGCCFDFKLSCICLETKEIYSVETNQKDLE